VTRLRLRVRTSVRDPKMLPSDGDDALGEAMFGHLLTSATRKGPPRPALVALTGDQVEQFDVAAVHQYPEPARTRLMAAIAGRPDLECGAIAGTMQLTRGRIRRQRALMVFIEWPDNRWWTAWQLLDADGKPVEGEPVVRRAVDGWPRPRGIGGWFARCRREQLHLQMKRQVAPSSPQAGLNLIH
jgi:hypothetical protein